MSPASLVATAKQKQWIAPPPVGRRLWTVSGGMYDEVARRHGPVFVRDGHDAAPDMTK